MSKNDPNRPEIDSCEGLGRGVSRVGRGALWLGSKVTTFGAQEPRNISTEGKKSFRGRVLRKVLRKGLEQALSAL